MHYSKFYILFYIFSTEDCEIISTEIHLKNSVSSALKH